MPLFRLTGRRCRHGPAGHPRTRKAPFKVDRPQAGGYKIDEIALKIVSELVAGLIQLDVIGPGHDHHDDATVLAVLDRTSKLRPFRLQLANGCLDVVAHQCDRVVARVIVCLTLPFAVRRVHAHLAQARFKNEPIVIEILGHVLPPQHVPQKRPRCVSIVGINQRMN